MKKKTDFIASLVAGTLFLLSAFLMYQNEKQLIYPILASLSGIFWIIYAFQTPKSNYNCVKNESYEN